MNWMRTGTKAVAFGLALASGVGLGGCFYGSCPDSSEFSYALRDGVYSGQTYDAVSYVGSYSVDDDTFEMNVDATAETVTVSFRSEGLPVVLTYDVVDFAPPE